MTPVPITFVSTGRADFGAVAEVVRAGAETQAIASRVVLCGDARVLTAEIEREALACSQVSLDDAETVNSPVDASLRIARLIPRLASEFSTHASQCVVVMGDRYELLAVLAAAIPLRLPLAHVSGGEITEGALDEQVRHAVTKAAHIHFVANEIFSRCLARMGEEAWRIHVTGDPALDRVRRADVATREDLEALAGLPIGRATVTVAFHPITNSPERTWREWEAIEAALEDYGDSVVVTGSNADAQGNELSRRQKSWCAARPNRRFIEHLGQRNFLGMLIACGCLVGNSSAGIWEAPSVGAPAVNLGSRQKGRLRGTNVLDLPEPTAEAVRAAIFEALTPQFRQRIEGSQNPYGDGCAAGRIVQVLRALPGHEKLLTKRFNEEN